jgi:hypothetical protein
MIKIIVKPVLYGNATFYKDVSGVEKDLVGITSEGDEEFVTIGVKTMDNEKMIDGRYIIVPKSRIGELIDCLKNLQV